jgi:hypothetical protein
MKKKRKLTEIKRLVTEDILKIKPLKKNLLSSKSVIDVLILHGLVDGENKYLDWIVSSLGSIQFVDGQQTRVVSLSQGLRFATDKIKEQKER